MERLFLMFNTRHSQQTNIHAPSGIRTQDLSRRAACFQSELVWVFNSGKYSSASTSTKLTCVSACKRLWFYACRVHQRYVCWEVITDYDTLFSAKFQCLNEAKPVNH